MTRVTSPALALRDHERICQRCVAMARAGQPYTKFCQVGRRLVELALQARAPRRRAA